MNAAPETSNLTSWIRAKALELGFDRVGFAPIRDSEHASHYRRWVESGNVGEMEYLAREDAVEKRANPSALVPGARSAVVVALEYHPGGPTGPEAVTAERAIFARYARNDDYHDLMRDRLIDLQHWIDRVLEPTGGRAYVDTGPLLERELGRLAGLGWFGRNTMLIGPRSGSYFFLGVLLLTIELEYDAPFSAEFCGTCASCLTGCPTGALLGNDDLGAPVMNAARCISYLTIELKGPIPRELRPLIGNRVYGCDICQEVCPHNNARFVQITREEAFRSREGVHGAELIELMAMDQVEFSRRFKGSAVKRAKRRGLLRNVAVALGNWRSPEAVPVLALALNDEEPLIRGHAAWALGRIGTTAAREAIRQRLQAEDDAWVRDELELAHFPTP